MAAEDLFPNALTLTANASGGGTPSVTLPAPIGATWVISSVTIEVFTTGTGGVGATYTGAITCDDATFPGVGIQVGAAAAIGNNIQSAEYQWTGKWLAEKETAFILGLSNPAVPDCELSVLVEGYAI